MGENGLSVRSELPGKPFSTYWQSATGGASTFMDAIKAVIATGKVV